MTKETLSLRVSSIRDETAAIKSYSLVGTEGKALPAFTPGAHIDLHLANGMVRSYSLFGDPSDRSRYELAIAKDINSRGGSNFLHETVSIGDIIEVGLPRNNFPLVETAIGSVFMAGGIGITPILSMIRRMHALGADWRLYYAARSRFQAAFLDALAIYGDRVRLHFDDERGTVFDVATEIRQASDNSHVYCCGPEPMLASFQAACEQRNPETVHVEHFSAAQPKNADADGFLVHLAKSKRTIEVGAGISILEVLLQNGFDQPYSCMEGTCGECEVRVLDGIPDHRDVVLSKKRRAENKCMIICCSRAKTSAITLDI